VPSCDFDIFPLLMFLETSRRLFFFPPDNLHSVALAVKNSSGRFSPFRKVGRMMRYRLMPSHSRRHGPLPYQFLIKGPYRAPRPSRSLNFGSFKFFCARRRSAPPPDPRYDLSIFEIRRNPLTGSPPPLMRLAPSLFSPYIDVTDIVILVEGSPVPYPSARRALVRHLVVWSGRFSVSRGFF